MARIVCLIRLSDPVTLICATPPHYKIAAALKVFNAWELANYFATR